jgi:hypothetical protein
MKLKSKVKSKVNISLVSLFSWLVYLTPFNPFEEATLRGFMSALAYSVLICLGSYCFVIWDANMVQIRILVLSVIVILIANVFENIKYR